MFGCRGIGRRQALVVLDQPARQGGLQVDLSLGNGADRRHQFIGGGLLGKVPGGAGCEHLHEVLLVVVHAESEDLGVRKLCFSRRVASRPSISGMLISIRAISGLSPPPGPGLRSGAGLAHDRIPSCGSRNDRNPVRTTSWSSTSSSLILFITGFLLCLNRHNHFDRGAL